MQRYMKLLLVIATISFLITGCAPKEVEQNKAVTIGRRVLPCSG